MFWVFKYLALVIGSLVGVAYITLLERKLLSMVGFRLGPYKVSASGLLQPIADAIKLANKQHNILGNSSFVFHYVSCFIMFVAALMLWNSLFSTLDLKFAFLFIMLILGFNSLNSIIAGWSTFSKYPLLGSVRTVAQLVSYEAALYLCLFFIFSASLCFNSFNYVDNEAAFMLLCVPVCFYIWVPSVLAELNRTPYDFSEGESELVSGFNTEFGAAGFTLIFLAEYSNIVFFSFATALLFFEEFLILFFFFFFFFIIWLRSVVPRYRFDLLMMLAWKFFIPFLTLMFVSLFLFLI